MDERLRASAVRGRGLVSARDVLTLGVSRHTLRWAVGRGDLVRLRQGVWCEREVWDVADKTSQHRLGVRAVQLVRPDSVACAESAAVCLDLPLPDVPASPLVTTVRALDRSGGAGLRAGGRGRRALLSIPEEVLTLPDGILVTTPARTVVDLARHLDLPWALAAADAVRRFHGVSRRRLHEAAARNPTAPGHPAAVLVARHADPRPESALESVARGVTIVLDLPLPVPQRWMGRHRPVYRVDLLVREHWTVIEADGKVKYRADPARLDPRITPGEQVWADKRRRDDLHDLGHEVTRFVMADYHHQHAWGRRLLRTFDRAHERRGLPLPDWGSGSRLEWR